MSGCMRKQEKRRVGESKREEVPEGTGDTLERLAGKATGLGQSHGTCGRVDSGTLPDTGVGLDGFPSSESSGSRS